LEEIESASISLTRAGAIRYTNSQIANELFLSVGTIEARRSHIQHKSGRISQAELVSDAREHDLFDQA
jgi:DNA-binding NarL/FixJ family response regulator